MKSQMGRANKADAKFALILGEDEIKNNTVAVKDMQLGHQEAVDINSIVEVLKDKLK
jgi:histidyl-tRNA synthetase